MFKHFIIIGFPFLLFSCKKNTNSLPISKKEAPKVVQKDSQEVAEKFSNNRVDFMPFISNQHFFKNKVFDLGQKMSLDSCNLETDCDCCGGNLITFDSDFYYISYCQNESSLHKGTFEIDDNRLLLVFHSKYISYKFDLNRKQDPSSSEFTFEEDPLEDIVIVDFLRCIDRIFIYLEFDEGHEFGTLDKTSNIKFINKLKNHNEALWLALVEI